MSNNSCSQCRKSWRRVRVTSPWQQSFSTTNCTNCSDSQQQWDETRVTRLNHFQCSDINGEPADACRRLQMPADGCRRLQTPPQEGQFNKCKLYDEVAFHACVHIFIWSSKCYKLAGLFRLMLQSQRTETLKDTELEVQSKTHFQHVGRNYKSIV